MSKLTTNSIEAPEITQSLDELAKEGTRRTIVAALELEVDQYVQELRHYTKRLQTREEERLHEIMHAPDCKSALKEIALFSEEYGARYHTAVETLTKGQ